MPRTKDAYEVVFRGTALIPYLILHGDRVQVQVVDLTDASADFSYQQTRIRIKPGLEPQAQLRCLAHEIVHFSLAWSGLSALLEEPMEEAICDALGSGIIELIRDNKPICNAIWETYAKQENR